MLKCTNTSRPPRVLQVMGSLNTGGAETMILSAAETLTDACAMDFLVFERREGTLEARAMATGRRVLRLPSPRESGPGKFVRDLKRLLLEENYDVVHSHINLASGLVMKAAHAAGIPVRISHSHGTEHPVHSLAGRAYRWLSRRLILRYSTTYAACGEEAGESLFGTAWSLRRGSVVPNGVQVDKFLSVRDNRSSVRAELGLSEGQRVIGMIARLVDFKNHDFMLDVMALDESISGNCILLIVGDGPLRAMLESRVVSLGLTDRVRFLGLRDDVPRILGALDVIAMPSLYEGLPVALVEAQAAGVPVVASDRVTREGDLGLGLISWLPLGEPAEWLHRLRGETPRPEPTAVKEGIESAGYDVRSSANGLLKLYNQDAGQK